MPLDQYRPIYTGWKLLGPEPTYHGGVLGLHSTVDTHEPVYKLAICAEESIDSGSPTTSPLVSSRVGENDSGTTFQHAGLDRAHCRNLRPVRSLGEDH